MDDSSIIAGKMANVLFNLAQKAGHTLTTDDCALFDKLRKEWDSSRQLSAQSVSADADAVDAKVPLSIPTPARVKAIAEANGGQEGECEWHFPRENLMDFAYALMTYSVDKYVAAQSTEGAKG